MSSPTSHRTRRGHIAVALAVAFSLGAVGTASLVEAKGKQHDSTEQPAKRDKDSKRSTRLASTTTVAPETVVAPSETTADFVEPSAEAQTLATETPTDASTTVDRYTTDAYFFDTAQMELAVEELEAVYGGVVDSVLAAERDRGTSFAEVADQIGADHMWATGFTGAGIDVAIIDTGVAPVAGLAETDVVIGPDLSFEGAIDQVAGLDTYGHGTHMAGLVAGVAPDARIVSVKVADNTGATDVSQVIAAIDWVVQNRREHGLNIRVLNLSYNTTGEQSYLLDPLSKAVENAWNHGIVVVTSAGNEGFGSFGLANPATNPKVLAISSAYWTDDQYWLTPEWAPSGNGTRNPDVLAPGVSIESLRVPGSRIDEEHPDARVGDSLFRGSGTSQSAAIVSGATALLLQQRPYLSPDDIKHLLTSTAAQTWQVEGIKGNGVIDLSTAMNTEFEAALQTTEPATGLGSLEAARGDDHVEIGGEPLVGEITVTGAAWDPVAWVVASEAGTAWVGTDDWSGSSWSGSSWSGSSWSGSSWSGSSWSGSSWSGSSWSGSSWSGSSWSGAEWA